MCFCRSLIIENQEKSKKKLKNKKRNLKQKEVNCNERKPANKSKNLCNSFCRTMIFGRAENSVGEKYKKI